MTEKEELTKLSLYIQHANKIINELKRMEEEVKALPVIKGEMLKDTETISKFSPTNILPEQQTVSEAEVEQLFKKHYLVIQEKCIELTDIEEKFKWLGQKCNEEKTSNFSSLEQYVGSVKAEYIELEAKLMDTHSRMGTEKKAALARVGELCQKTNFAITGYLLDERPSESGVYSGMGAEVLNEDRQLGVIMQFLADVDRAELMLKRTSGLENSGAELARLSKLRGFLEFLLPILEGSFDDELLQGIMDSMNCKQEGQKRQEVTANAAKVNDLLTTTEKYNKSLKLILLQAQAKEKVKEEGSVEADPQIYGKINKIAKERLVLYEVIEMVYAESLWVYQELKGK
jgi:hypothetical protein